MLCRYSTDQKLSLNFEIFYDSIFFTFYVQLQVFYLLVDFAGTLRNFRALIVEKKLF